MLSIDTKRTHVLGESFGSQLFLRANAETLQISRFCLYGFAHAKVFLCELGSEDDGIKQERPSIDDCAVLNAHEDLVVAKDSNDGLAVTTEELDIGHCKTLAFRVVGFDFCPAIKCSQ